MYICYYIKPDTGCVLLQYAELRECALIQEFKDDENVPSYDIISLHTDDVEYMVEDAYKDLGRYFFEALERVTVGEGGGITVKFLHFPKNTRVSDIWCWIERECGFVVEKCKHCLQCL